MVPPATALAKNAATCAAARHTQVDTAERQPAAQTTSGAAAAGADLTVTPQLAYAAVTSACTGLLRAVLHASDQKEPEDMRLQGLGVGGEDAVSKAAVYTTVGMWCCGGGDVKRAALVL